MTEDVMKKGLLGSPNLECFELDNVVGIRRLEISYKWKMFRAYVASMWCPCGVHVALNILLLTRRTIH
ncbi:hypothetical protein H5410_003173 [Solanum commersonii]|uniref:Uncharacterized protein n=1 Tax=Solanum commersonii TaxID=4109 RepID=A0A9J6B4A9_SOLCO|nr:hypothetical protein H5410_003173 [Solanum commersonii]